MQRILQPRTGVSVSSQALQPLISSAARLATSSFGFEDVSEQEKTERVGKVFGGVANSYDLMNDLMSAGLHRLWKDRLVARLGVFPGMHHLDVAGGTGDIAMRVHKAIQAECQAVAKHQDDPVLKETGRVIVCDINSAMLNEGRQRRGAELLEWVLGDAEQLPFPDRSMDTYTIAFGIRNVTRIQNALEEARRVLKPGGQFLCMEFSQVALPGLKQLYDAYSFNVIPQIGRLVAGDADSYRYLVESIRRFPVQAEFANMIRKAGLQHVEYDNLSGGIVALHSGFRL